MHRDGTQVIACGEVDVALRVDRGIEVGTGERHCRFTLSCDELQGVVAQGSHVGGVVRVPQIKSMYIIQGKGDVAG